MTTRTAAELADALDARARELDNVEPHSGLDHDPRCIADAALDRAAASRLRELALALEPFARAARRFDFPNKPGVPWEDDDENVTMGLTVGDLRAARRALRSDTP